MPFFTIRPDEQDQAHRRRDVQLRPRREQQREGAAERQRRGHEDQGGRREAAELHDEHEEDQRGRAAEDEQQLAERAALRFVLPADLERVAKRQLHARERPFQLRHRSPEVTVLEARGDERHLPQVLALQHALAVRLAPRGKRAQGGAASLAAADGDLHQPHGIEAVRVRQTHADGHGAVRKPQVGRDLAEPARRELRRHIPGREPDAPGGHRVDLPRGLRVATLRADDVHHAADVCRRTSCSRSASEASTSGSSPKTFTSIGVGFPSRSPIMSCSSWTNSTSTSGAASCSLSRSSSTTSSAGRRVPARLQAHQDVALVLLRSRTAPAPIRCGASRPRRRACDRSRISIFRTRASVSSSAVPGGVR